MLRQLGGLVIREEIIVVHRMMTSSVRGSWRLTSQRHHSGRCMVSYCTAWRQTKS